MVFHMAFHTKASGSASRFSLGMIGLLFTSSINQNRRMKSSFVKYLEHNDEFPGQLPFSPL